MHLGNVWQGWPADDSRMPGMVYAEDWRLEMNKPWISLMPGRYGSRATKFLYLDGARMTGADGPADEVRERDGTVDREIHAGRIEASRGRAVRSLKRDHHA